MGTGMGKLLSGKVFNKKFAGIRFVKLTNKKENHNGFQFKTGLNIDTIKFNPRGQCRSGGIYFCELDKIGLWVIYGRDIFDCQFCVNYRKVTIPDDAQVYVEKNKFKTNKIILGEKESIWDDIILCELVVSHNGNNLYYVKNQTDRICELAVSQNGMALEYVKKQTDRICELAVRQNGWAIYYVKNKTNKLCELAVTQDGTALIWIKDQTEKICELAVMQNGMALQYVKDQTEKICKLAVNQNKSAKTYSKFEKINDSCAY
jgi:hypothetical protein